MKHVEMTWEQVEANGFVVHENKVYDLKRFNDHHRGGPFLKELAGKNITFHLLNAHRTNAEFEKMLKALQVGTIQECDLPPEDQDLYALYRESVDEGLFEYKISWLFWDAVKILFPFAVGLALVPRMPVWSGIFLTLHVLLACWWVHDAAHNSIFKSEKTARFFTGLVSILFTGTYAVEYQYIIHRLHHGFTNVLKLDGALSTSVITWHESQETKLSRKFRPLRKFLWLGPVLISIVPFLLGLNVVMGLNRKRFWTLGALALRWYFFTQVVFLGHPWLAILPILAGSYLLGLISSLNHFHMEITPRLNSSYLRAVAFSTQNISDRSWWWTEFVGGLNYHIEHHLFTSMPRHSYPIIAPRVEKLFQKHDLPYHASSKTDVFGSFLRALGGASPLSTKGLT